MTGTSRWETTHLVFEVAERKPRTLVWKSAKRLYTGPPTAYNTSVADVGVDLLARTE